MSRYFNLTRRRRSPLLVAMFATVAVCVGGFASLAQARRLISEEEAGRLGLTRAWFAQVRLDSARSHVERAVLAGDRLYVLTSAGLLQAFNALTGESMWVAPVGNPKHPSLGPAANDAYVALLNGSTLFVLDQKDGRPVKVRPVGGAPGAAPALSKTHVFVPLVTGRIEAYPLDAQILTPWYYQSFGRAMVTPLTTPDSFVWTTDSGHMYVGSTTELGVRFRLETGSEIVAPPAYHQPYVYAATLSGEVFALNEITGERRWKYATGFPVTRAPAAVDKWVFVTSQEPALHCIDAEKGSSIWEVPKVAQFAAASRNRVYGVDDLGAFVVLDLKTGQLIARMPGEGENSALVNDQTDRIYLVSDDGLVQCFHELDAKKPLYHNPPPAPPTDSATGQPAAPTDTGVATEPQPPAEEPAAEPAEEAPAEGEMPEESPFGVDDEDPFG